MQEPKKSKRGVWAVVLITTLLIANLAAVIYFGTKILSSVQECDSIKCSTAVSEANWASVKASTAADNAQQAATRAERTYDIIFRDSLSR